MTYSSQADTAGDAALLVLYLWAGQQIAALAQATHSCGHLGSPKLVIGCLMKLMK